jgi:preprotein translocase subunit YajC
VALTTITTGALLAMLLLSWHRAIASTYQGLEMPTSNLQQGDQVRTDSGVIGTVVHTSRLTVFVALGMPEHENEVKAFLLSQLTKVEQPELTTA